LTKKNIRRLVIAPKPFFLTRFMARRVRDRYDGRMLSATATRRLVTLLLLLYVALQGYAAAAPVLMPHMNHAACGEQHGQSHDQQQGMADCLAQCQLCGGLAMAPGFGKPSAPAPHDLTGPRIAIIAAQYDGESHPPQQARAPPGLL
jgi:hypothetical protein